MSLPAQIQRQVDEARSKIAQFYGTDAGNEPADTTVVDETPSGETPANDEPTTPAVAPAPAPAPESSAAPAPAGVTNDDDENNATYAQRWRTLQGKFNTLLRTNEQLVSRVSNFEQLIAQMQAAPAAPAAAPSAAPAQSFVTEKDVKEYGADMADFVRRAARDEMTQLAQAVGALSRRIDQLSGVVPAVQNLAEQQKLTAQDRFLQQLTQAVPDWQTVNDDPRFHDWLRTIDPMTRIDRQTYLRDAELALDIERVVNIFRSAKDALGLNPSPAATPAPAPLPALSPAQRLERQVAPGRASAATPAPQPKQGKQWTRADIAAFYDAKLRGQYKGREAEASALEADIFKAQREGRVTG